jgi:predicted transposase/invertase (TIGR01784 family)
LQEYCGLLSRKYELDVRQYVIYIGAKEPRMPLFLKSKKWFFSFDIIDFRTLDYRRFLDCSTAEETILAILANFAGESPETVAQEIVSRLYSLSTSEFGKYAKQLEILAKLRNLQQTIIKTLENMALQYDLETDIRFLQGKEKGKVEGKIEGKGERNREVACKAILLGYTDEAIAALTGLSIEQIQALREEPQAPLANNGY